VLLLYAQFLPERLETTHQNLTAFQTPQMCWKIHGVQLWECSKSKALETVWEGHTLHALVELTTQSQAFETAGPGYRLQAAVELLTQNQMLETVRQKEVCKAMVEPATKRQT
jgi:hypothetical protein